MGNSAPAMEVSVFAEDSNCAQLNNDCDTPCFLDENRLPAGGNFDPDHSDVLDFLVEYYLRSSSRENFEDIAEIADYVLDNKKHGQLEAILELDETIGGGNNAVTKSNIPKRNLSVSTSIQTDEPTAKCKKQGTKTQNPVGRKRGPSKILQGKRTRNPVGKKRGPSKTKAILEDNCPAVPTVHDSFTFTTCARGVHPAFLSSVPQVQVQLPVASIGPSGRHLLSHVPAASSVANCVDWSSGGLQVMSTFTALPQHLISFPLGNHVSNIIICTAPSSPGSPPIITPFLPAGTPAPSPPGSSSIITPFLPTATPTFSPDVSTSVSASGTTYFSVDSTLRGIPTSPDRSSSCSPFAPTAADMPMLPQSASMSQCGGTGWEACSKQSLTLTATPPGQPLKKPKYVEDFQTLLKEHHKQQTCKFTTTESECPLDSVYTDVSLVHGHIESKPGKNGIKGKETEPPIFDLAEKENKTVERSNLFQVMSGKHRETKTIALLGHAGMGKSVLVNKVCQDWSTGGYSEFAFVFCFECRQLNLSGKQYSLKDLLFEISAKPLVKCDEVFKYILRNPDEVLLIFDGFDEFQEFDGLMQCSLFSSTKQSYTMKQLFAGLFLKKLLRGCTLLITARPKDRFNQYLSKVDKVVEMIGFSPQDVDQYLKKHFEALPFGEDCINKMKECQYLFSYCYIPLMCRIICVFCEKEFKAGHKRIPLTLTSLFLNVLKQHLSTVTSDPTSNSPADKQCFAALASLALTLGEKHQNAMKHNTFSSTDVKDFALKYGFMQPFTLHSETLSKEFGSMFSNFTLQNFLIALHLMLSDSVRDKSCIKYISFEPKKKKLQDFWADIVRRFLTGLLFLEADLDLSFASEKDTLKSVHKKQKTVSEYLKVLKTNELSPKKLLELCHCLYESQDSGLLSLTASKIKGDLSFLNIRLSPPDVYVLQHIFTKSSNSFFLDLRNTGIDLQDLKQLVGLERVVLFRASLSDTVRLWESLQQAGDVELLRLYIKKLTIQPFKAKTMKDIADLSALVHIQEDLDKCDIHEIPAIKTLKKLEFALGPVFGLEGFLELVKILPAFSSLQHLDLDCLSENNIGDKGVEKLTEIFSSLTLLETLHLSQNGITDLGVEKLAKALPSLACLQKLSLYHNQICDAGAEKIADTLPMLTSLTTLALEYNKITDIGAQKLTESLRNCTTVNSLTMWNANIPHGVLERLQQQDSRIS